MIKIKAPGRICFFGEHQDYLGYPVIAMSISKFIYLNAEKIPEKVLKIELTDIDQTIEIPLINKELEYESTRDYLRSGYNIFLRKGARFKSGFRMKITGDIPINAGCGSSSALVIAWLYFLNLISDLKLKSNELALEGYNCEVREFSEAGGQMDHFTSVFGNLIFLRSNLNIPSINTYDIKLEGFVLGYSLEKKETVEDLIRVKALATKSFEKMKELMPEFDPYFTPLNEINQFLPSLNKEFQ